MKYYHYLSIQSYLKILILSTIIYCFLVVNGYASETLDAAHKNTMTLPSMDDYLVTQVYHGHIAEVKLSTSLKAKKFKTRLTEDARNGPNFSGHYTVIEIGCGTNCQYVWVIDAINGNIIGEPLHAIFGALYDINSKLLILNPLPEDADISYFGSVMINNCETKYFVMDHGKLKLVFQEPMESLLRKKLNDFR